MSADPYYSDDLITLWNGDALTIAQTLPDRSVQSIVTSPPYFGLRDYGEDLQMGAEGTPADYVAGMVGLFRELRRVLAEDGTLWLNLGDSYVSSPPGNKDGAFSSSTLSNPERQFEASRGHTDKTRLGVPAKNLLGIPWRVAFALQDDGWILRSDIIWAKLSTMPESVTDRPTKAHEYLFLLAKSPRYYYDAAAIAEPVSEATVARLSQPGLGSQEGSTRANGGAKTNGTMKAVSGTETKNKRTVWSVAPVPFAGAHFAVYPPELIRPCILAGSRPGDTILDPFSGSGTTGMVATQEGRKYIGIDLNKDYLDLSLATRFRQPVLDFGSLVSSTERKES